MKRPTFVSKVLRSFLAEDDALRTPLHQETREMIKGIHGLADTTVREVMVPRIDSVFLSIDLPTEELVSRIAETGHSRFPVYKDTIDNVVGMLYAKDLLQYLTNGETIRMDTLLRKPFFVPESKRLDGLLREMKRRRVHIAVAVDEYGGVSGLVCMEDIIEEIVGDIQDEFDNEREDLLELGNHTYLCDARINLEDMEETLGITLPDDDYDTLGGFVFDLFGKIPVKFEKVSHDNIDFIVQDMDGHKIKTIKVMVKPDEAPRNDER
ncbi:hemolysin family protein [Alkalispirochaeta americana]|uniref:hemolysin family protein n=1 Tax=Alkalispirochaeta americana TaxID=159291 RepID=UPI00097063A6|nr:hemolysin family protein [Alkalispirochaeta americana]